MPNAPLIVVVRGGDVLCLSSVLLVALVPSTLSLSSLLFPCRLPCLSLCPIVDLISLRVDFLREVTPYRAEEVKRRRGAPAFD